jgi:hypothetical protein
MLKEMVVYMSYVFDYINIIEVDVSLADSELINYVYFHSQKKIIVTIKTWDANLVEFIFYDVLAFIHNGDNYLSDFCVRNTTPNFFKERLEKEYKIIPDDHSYKIYAFLSNAICLDIMSPYYEYKIEENI